MGCWFFPAPQPPYMCTCVRCPGPLGSCSPVCPLGALLCRTVFWATWLLFIGVPARCVVLPVECAGRLGSCLPVCPLRALLCLCSVLGHLAPVHRCAPLVRCFACAVSWATWLLFTGMPARCVVLRVRCSGPLGSCSPLCPLGMLCCVCGVLGKLAPVHWCARFVRCFACAVSWGTWLLFTGVSAQCVALRVRCPGPQPSCSPVCLLGVLFCLCGVLGHMAPVQQCARWVRCLCVLCPGPLGSCSPVCPLGVLFCLCGVLGHLALVHRCARSVRCFACAVSLATWLLFTGVPARCVVLLVRRPWPLDSCSPVPPRGLLFCVCGVLGHLAPVHRCARSVCCLCVRCPGPLGSCSAMCPLGALFCLCLVLGHLAPVHRCARVVSLFCLCGVLGHLAPAHRCAPSVCCVACAVSWATWRLFTGVPARCVALRVRCPRPLGSCPSVCPLGALLCVCGVLDHLVPVHRSACSVCCFACAVSWAAWLLFTGAPAQCLACVCGVLGRLAPVHRCARSVCCFACAVSLATWLLFTGVPARCVVLLVWCPGPLRSCSLMCPLGASFCLWGVLGHLAPVQQCACAVCCVACAVSWATWLLFTGVPARRVVLCVRCPGPPAS